MEGGNLIIAAKQEVKEAGGSRSRVFEQKFSLPPGVRTDTVRSSLNREGYLVVTASKETENLASLENKMDRVMAPTSWDSKPSAFDEVRRDSSSDERRIMSAFDDLRRDSSKKGSLFGGSLYDDKSIFATNSEQSGVSHVEYDDKNYKVTSRGEV